MGVVAAFPEAFLWLLGSKYQHLRTGLKWTAAGSFMGYLNSVLWTIHSSRRWVFWWGTIAYIVALTVTQCICIAVLDLSTTLAAIYLNLVTNVVVSAIHVCTAFVGFRLEASLRVKSLVPLASPG